MVPEQHSGSAARTVDICRVHQQSGFAFAPGHHRPAILLCGALILLLGITSAWAVPSLLPLQARFGGAFTGGVLDGVRGAAVSSDGAYLYVASEFDDAVAVFNRNPLSGALSFVQVVHDGVDLVDGLDAANSVAISPDGAHVYVAAFLDDAISVFSRNGGTGQLSFIEAVVDGVGGANGLRGAHHAIVSPDGKNVYVAGFYEDAIGVFDRDSITGQLTFNQVVRDDVGGVEGLDGVLWVHVSPDGLHLYAAGAVDNAVAVFSRNPTTGVLTFVEAQEDGVGGVNGLAGARVTMVSPDGAHVYAASGGILVGATDNAVAVFERDAGTGALTYVTSYFDGTGGITALAGGYDMTMTADGSYLYVAGFIDDSVVAFSRNSSTGLLTLVDEERDGVGGVTLLKGGHAVALSPGDEHLYAAGFWEDALVVFERDLGTGALSLVEEEVEGALPSSRLEAVAVSPDGNHVYTAGFTAASVTGFARNTSSGLLGATTSTTVLPELNGASGVAISPDGEHVYATGKDGNAVVAFDRDLGTGTLTTIDIETDGAGGVDGLDGARAVVVSPDGGHVYVAGEDDDAIAVFGRDGVTGVLTFVEVVRDGVGGADGLDGVDALAVSPDGAHLYAAGGAENAVAVFERDGVTGALSFVEVERDGVGGVDRIAGAAGVAISPNGAHVYVAARTDNAITTFSRNAITGELSFSSANAYNIDGALGLGGATGVTISADGVHVLVASTVDNAIAVFGRNNSTGALDFFSAEFDNVGGINALRGAFAVDMPSSGAHVYVASPGDNALAVFELTSLCPTTPITICRAPLRSKLIFSNSAGFTADRVVYSWLFGSEVSPQVFGNPANGSTSYALCVYDNFGGSPNPVLALSAPRGGVCNSNGRACWRQYFDDYFYRDTERTPDGIKNLRLHSGRDGDPYVTLKAKGDHLPPLPLLPLTAPIIAQVINSHGECWSSTFDSSEVLKNGALPSGRQLLRAIETP